MGRSGRRGLTLAGIPLGDCWRHPAIKTDDATSGLVPLHKLSQWLTYSLIEPLQRAGLEVTDIDGLTGLAEYRNGGLFVDLGVLTPARSPPTPIVRMRSIPLLVVEWRALTVALLDRACRQHSRASSARDAAFAAAREPPRRRHLGGGPRRCLRAPSRRFAAASRSSATAPFSSPSLPPPHSLDEFQEHPSWKASRSSIIRWSSTS